MVIPTFGCDVRFNPWYVDFISGLNSCENQPPSSWLIVKVPPLLWVKIGLIRNLFCGLQYSAGLLCFMAKPSALVILCVLCSYTNIHGGHGWHSILKHHYCTACANIVHTSKLRIYKPDEPGDFIIPCYVQYTPCGGHYPQPSSVPCGGQCHQSLIL
jgi:hypothetical protein